MLNVPEPFYNMKFHIKYIKIMKNKDFRSFILHVLMQNIITHYIFLVSRQREHVDRSPW